MSTRIYLSNDPSDLSGYLKAYINTASPNSSATASTAVTTLAVVTTTTLAMTLTAGGTVAKWITVPLAAAVTVADKPIGNFWGLESSASGNAMIAFTLAQYTTSAQSAFLTTSVGTEFATSSGRNAWVITETVTSTAFAVGDRLIVTPVLAAVGTMGGSSFTATMSYNGSTPATAGDTWIVLDEDLEPGAAQVGSGSVPGIKGKGVSYFYDLAQRVQAGQNEGLFAFNATAQVIIDEANNQKALV